MLAPGYRGGTAPVAGGSTTSPAGTQVGDLVVVYTWERTGAGSPTFTKQSGFEEIRNHAHDDGSTDGRLAVAYIVATQAGAQSYQAYTTSTGSPAWATGCFVLTKGTFDIGSLPPSAGVSQTNNAVPNPPQVAGLIAGNAYLIAAIAAWHLASAATVTPTAPSGYGNLLHLAGSSTSELASATVTGSGATSFDPGTFGDDVAPNGTCAITIAFVGVPPEEGFGVAALTLGGSGAGVSSRAGSGAPGLTLGGSGEGRTVHAGFAAAALVLALVGEGEAPIVQTAEGFGVAALALAGDGEGRTVYAGSSAPALTLGGEGEGRTVHAGAGSAALELGAAGVGESIRSGAGVAALELEAAGEGRTIHAGTGAPALTLAGAGEGRAVHAGSGEAALALEGAGEGEEPLVEQDGFGVAVLALSGEGEGRAAHAGAGVAVLSLAGDGEGRTVRAGAGTAALTLTGQGQGVTARSGFGVCALALAGQGSGGEAAPVVVAFDEELQIETAKEWTGEVCDAIEFTFRVGE